MKKKKFPKSIRKHIRQGKARIRREVLDLKKREELIKKMHEKFSSSPKTTKKTSKPKLLIKDKKDKKEKS